MSSESDGGPEGATLSYRHILEREAEDALQSFSRPPAGLFVSGVTAGLTLSFGALFVGMVLTFADGFDSTLTKQVAIGASSSIAFLFVIIGQTELFTAHTTMAVLPVLDGRGSIRDLGRVWGITYTSNLVGCVLFAGLIAVIGPGLGVVEPAAAGSIAEALLPFPWWVILLSGVIAGWLMGLATWLSAASRDTSGRLLVVVLVTATIGFGPFHHCILDTTAVLSAMFMGQGITIFGLLHFLVPATLGNVVGGAVFVGLLNYGHIALGGDPQNVDFETE